MIIYTGQITKSKRIINPIDITIKSANTNIGNFFVPTWELVKLFKSGEINWFEYESLYEQLIESRINNTGFDIFDKIFDTYYQLTLMCYCQEGQNCHRNIVKKILFQYAEYIKTDYTDGGFLK